MPTTIPTAPTPGTIDDDLGCVVCDYNLRGLRTDGLCPECGHEIALSLRGDRLSNADPIWLGRVSAGVTLLGIAAAAGTLLYLTWDFRLSLLPYRILSALTQPASTMFAVWLLTEPEFVGAGQVRTSRLRMPLRIVGTATFAWFAAQWFDVLGGTMSALIYIALFIATTAMLYQYLAPIAQRSGNAFLERHTPVVMFALIAFAVLQGILPHVGGSRGEPPYKFTLFVGTLIGGYNAVLLSRYALVLHRAVVAARRKF